MVWATGQLLLAVSETTGGRTGAYPYLGQRHLNYLRENKRVLLSGLQLSGKLNSYLADIDKQAEEMCSRLVKQMAEREGITEQLKAANQMEWVRQMNNIRIRANEIVLRELIYNA